MDRFDYKIPQGVKYLSSGMTPGDIEKPVAWGSSSSFYTPFNTKVGRGELQLIVEPAVDDTIVIQYDQLIIKYLQNGVYVVNLGEDSTRIVAKTGPIVIKLAATSTELDVSVDGVRLRHTLEIPDEIDVSVSPESGIFYDKFLYDHPVDVDELINKEPRYSSGGKGLFTPIVRDKWFEPKIVTTEEMDTAYEYRVSTRKLTYANTSAAFYSNTDLIEKSTDGSNWEPVQKVEFHGESPIIFRSTDPNFTLAYFDTNMTEFIIGGATVTTTGEIYKVGSNVGSIFSHDSYRIHNGSITIGAEGLRTVSILGYIGTTSDNLIMIDNAPYADGYKERYFKEYLAYQSPSGPVSEGLGKMHLYTFLATEDTLTIESDDLYIAGIGINVDHESTMSHLTGVSQISYADELDNMRPGVTINSDREYAVLDLQWGV